MYQWPKLDTPKISIVICNYNYERYLPAAIDSVLLQTYKPFEVVVVDDGSTDGSVSLIKNKYPDIQLIVKENEGQISAYNEGFKRITGDVVLFLDSDDELMPEALTMVSKQYTQDIVKVHFKMRVVDKDGNDLNSVLPSHLDVGDCGSELLKSGSLYKSPPASGNTYRVEALKKVFPLPTSKDEKHGADYFCIYGVSLLGLLASINLPLFKYRIHDSASSIGASLGFGNAIKKHDRSKVMQRRWDMLSVWIASRLGSNYTLKPTYLDFTQQKFFYAQDVINASGISDRLTVARKHFKWLSRSIFARADFNFLKKTALVTWMLLLLVLPKSIALMLAKKVCNPV